MRPTLRYMLALLLLLAPAARADVSYPLKPRPRDFTSDGAKLLTEADAAAIKATADKLLADDNIALVVATIDSMSSYGATGWPIERYAMNLFDEWGLGSPEHNYGVLLLVSKGDRKARIELGKAFTRERDQQASDIMSGTIVPRFKRGDFSGGIRAGVQELDAMARETRIAHRGTGTLPAEATPGSSRPVPAPAPPTQPQVPLHDRVLSPSSSGFHPGVFLGPLVCFGIGLVVLLFVIFGALRRSISGGSTGVGSPGGLGGLGGMGYGRGWGPGYGWGGGYSTPPWWWWVGQGGLGNRGWGGGDRDSSSSSSSSHSAPSSTPWGGFGGGGGGSDFGGSSGGSFGGGFSGGGGATGSW